MLTGVNLFTKQGSRGNKAILQHVLSGRWQTCAMANARMKRCVMTLLLITWPAAKLKSAPCLLRPCCERVPSRHGAAQHTACNMMGTQHTTSNSWKANPSILKRIYQGRSSWQCAMKGLPAIARPSPPGRGHLGCTPLGRARE